jgi:DNA-binding CsgD family transcriptional regulator
MRRIAPTDASGVLRVVEAIEATIGGDSAEPLGAPLLDELQALIPASVVTHAEFDADRLDLRSYVATHDAVIADGDDWWTTYAEFVAGDETRPQDGAARMAELMGPWRKRPWWYFDFVVPEGVRDVLKVWLPVPAPMRSILMFDRSEDFSSRDKDVLSILQGHLAFARDNAILRHDLRAAAPALTPREAEVLGWAARGLTNGTIATRLHISQATVAKHLENLYLKLDVHSRAEAAALAGAYLRSGAAPNGPSADAARGVPDLTRRELEIMTWAARGQRNDEIAAQLFITPRTVAKHLELAFDKLGARSRLEAVSILREVGTIAADSTPVAAMS